MNEAIESEKDEWAARALSRLPQPPTPDGLADRISARAVAMPQTPAGELSVVEVVPSPVSSFPSSIGPVRVRRSRWPAYASAAAIVAVTAAGFVGWTSGPADGPVVAKGDRPQPAGRPRAPTPEQELAATQDTAKVVRAAPSPAPASAPPKSIPPPPEPKPVELAVTPPPPPPTGEGLPGQTVGPTDLAQQIVPPSIASGPVYGPPAPSGLGIAGVPSGGPSVPGDAIENRRGPRGGMPGNGPGPRGPGHRR